MMFDGDPGQGPGKPQAVTTPITTPDDADFQKWKAAQRAAQTPDDAEFQAWKAQQGGPTVPAGTSGTWGNEPAPASNAAHLLNTFSGVPGLSMLEAASAAGASHLRPSMFGGQPITYSQAAHALSDVEGQIDPSTARKERFLGSAVTSLAMPFLPKNPVAAGALLGGADEALSANPDESLNQRAGATAGGTLAGAAFGGVMKGAGNIAQKTGLTDLIGSGLRTAGARINSMFAPIASSAPAPVGAVIRSVASAPSDLGQSIGTTGAANRLLAQRQSLLDQLSTADQTSGQVMNAQVDARKAEANALYNAARNDKSLIADPRVGAAMQDPRMQTLFQVVRQRLGLPSNPVTVTQGSPLMSSVVAGHVGPGAPTVTAPTPAAAVIPPGPPGRMGMALVPATPGTVSVDLPSPEDLAMAKRLLGQIVTQKFAAGGIEPGEAAQLAPRIDDLRDALHDASPAWAKADQFYTNAMGFERGYQKAYGMQSTPSADALTPNKLKNPESLTSWMQSGPSLARTSGVQAGAAQRIASAIKKAPLQSDIDQTLAGANGVLAPTAPAAAARGLAFGTPSDAATFENALTNLRQGARQDAASRAPWTLIPARPFNRFRATNPLDTPQGRSLLDQLGVQANVRAPTAAMARGDAIADYLRNLGLVSANSPFANP